MTSREPDRYEVKAQRLYDAASAGHGSAADIAAALRREHDAALDEAAQIVEQANWSAHPPAVAQRIRALASPAAAPAAEPDQVSRLLGRGYVENPREGEPGDAETYSEPAAPAPQIEPALRIAYEMGYRDHEVGRDRRPARVALNPDFEALLTVPAPAQRAEAHEPVNCGIQLRNAEKRIGQMEAAIRWACGEATLPDGRWFDPQAFGHAGSIPRYWWRSVLRLYSGVVARAATPWTPPGAGEGT